MPTLKREIDTMIERYQPDFFYINDDAFMARPKPEIAEFADMYKDIKIPFWFQTRFEDKAGTNPEELIGAAHAGCVSMFLSAVLSGDDLPPTRITTSATVHLGDGPTITTIELETEADVPNIEDAKFQEYVANAKENCPVSKALAAVAEFKGNAKLG